MFVNQSERAKSACNPPVFCFFLIYEIRPRNKEDWDETSNQGQRHVIVAAVRPPFCLSAETEFR